MNVVIIGCGRTGRELASMLHAEGDTVRVVDVDPLTESGLPHKLAGSFVAGSALSREVLDRAGIEQAEAVVVLTSDDCVNAVVAGTARNVYRVPRVVARRFLPSRGFAYKELGITSVSSVQATVNRVTQLLHHEALEPSLTFGNGETLLVRTRLPAYLTGRAVSELNVPGEIQVVEVTRHGHSIVPEPTTVLGERDTVSFVVVASSLSRLHSFVGRWS